MKIKVIKPIKITEVGDMLLPVDFETEISNDAAEIFIKKGFVNGIEDIKNIEVIYDHVILVLKGVSLDVPEGSIVALLGGEWSGEINHA